MLKNDDFFVLRDYILDVYNISELTEKMVSQIELFLARKIPYKDMLIALRYFYEECDGSVTGGNDGIGIVPHVLERAKAYYKKEAEMAEVRKQAFLQQRQNFRVIKRNVKESLNERKREQKIVEIGDL